MTPGKGSKYREFYDLSGRITCMVTAKLIWVFVFAYAKRWFSYDVTLCYIYSFYSRISLIFSSDSFLFIQLNKNDVR